jgi:hypothetical protein
LEGLRLLVRQGTVGSAVRDGLGIDPRPRSSVEAAENDPIAGPVEQREREALVATRVLERVVADDPDPLDRPPADPLLDGGPRREPVDVPGDGRHAVEVRLEDARQGLPVGIAGERVQAPAEPPQAATLDDDDHQEDRDDDDEPDDRRSDDRCDGGVQVDRWVLPE